MGACDFYSMARGKTPQEAFQNAREEAQHQRGHGGYTGTVAEKRLFTLVGTAKTSKEALDMASEMLDKDDERVSDKWGPAGCVEIQEGGKTDRSFLFFGWASS
jgi:predicted RNase H-like HicB family nuclease